MRPVLLNWAWEPWWRGQGTSKETAETDGTDSRKK